MPRAFLITRRRYDGTGEFEETGREYSPERVVRIAEYGGGQQPTSDGASECGSEESSSECPEELYNLTKLAEVSLAAAAGTLVVHPTTASLYQRPLEPLRHQDLDRSRLFFERIEAERESLIELTARRISDEESQGYDVFKSEDSNLPEATTITTSNSTTDDFSSSSMKSEHHELQQQDNITGEDHECPDCGKKYSTSSNLARHRQTHRSLGDKKARRCPHCDKVYVSIPAFSMHVRTHNQGCKCHYCGKCFSRPWLLQGHIRTHTGEKPFKCTICNKAFADKSNLRAHIQTHSNTKPHVCARCGKAFALKSYLYKHEESSCMRSHHHQQQREKRDTSTSPISRLSQPTASPTSVIVPPRNSLHLEQQPRPNSAFSAIIKHTKTSPDRTEHDLKRPRYNNNNNNEVESEVQSKDLLSRMVIRTSVISPNPEHLRFGEKKQQQQQQQQTQQTFDFNDPTRVSAFSRPQQMTLNLAIA